MRNLLKYDFKYTWRIWWIAAVVAVFSTILGCMSINRTICHPQIDEDQFSRSVQGILDGLSISGIIVYVIALAAFFFLIELVVLYRYYKNLFTDEGYLTFTLPVREETILTSKTISGFLWYLATAVAIIILAGIGLLVSMRSLGESWADVLEGLAEVLRALNEETGGYAPIFLLEGIVMVITGCVFNILLGYVSITIGSIIAKKNKLLCAIGIYFAICIVLSIITNVIGITGIFNLDYASDVEASKFISIMFLLVILYFVVISAIAYVLNLQLLKKKLNLA